MKILTIVGARPQFVKAAVVSRAIARSREAGAEIQEVIVHTGQHYDPQMSDVFFDEMDIPRPAIHLEIGGLSHGAMTGRMLERIESVIERERPRWVLVYGDTNSTLAGALAAAKLHIPVTHVEAGLRSFNKRMPEEINRVLTDHVSDLLFAPTTTAVENLLREGLARERILEVGDVMFDASRFYLDRAASRSHIASTLSLESGGYVLSTVHRAENTDSPSRLAAIVEGLAQVADQMSVVLPLHPRTRKIIASNAVMAASVKALTVIDPVGYLDMVMLERHAAVIATDSGGVQKEAYFYGVPCVTLRDETEWVELLEAGANRLAPPQSAEAVKDAVLAALATRGQQFPGVLYGDGNAAERIIQALVRASH
jgi:UDP-GlcNAc3NAcA epimerase